MITITITIKILGVQHRDAFITTLGSSWAYLSVCISVSLSLCLVVRVNSGKSKRAARNCA